MQHVVNELNIESLIWTHEGQAFELACVEIELITCTLQPTYLEGEVRAMSARGPQFFKLADNLSRLATDAAALQCRAEPRIQRCEVAHAIIDAIVQEINLVCRNGDIVGARRATGALRSEMVRLSGDLGIKDVGAEGRRIASEVERQLYQFRVLRRIMGGGRRRRNSVVD